MKNESLLPCAELHNQEVQMLSDSQLRHKVASNTLPVFYRGKSVVRIVRTTLWTSHPDEQGEKKPRRKVYYRKPLLTPQGKLDKERMIYEIALRQ